MITKKLFLLFSLLASTNFYASEKQPRFVTIESLDNPNETFEQLQTRIGAQSIHWYIKNARGRSLKVEPLPDGKGKYLKTLVKKMMDVAPPFDRKIYFIPNAL